MSSAALASTTFYGTRSVPGFTATYSITTDDTVGVLSLANITGFTMVISDGTNSDSFSNTLCFFCLVGNALSSTGTDLTFNYDLAGNNAFWLLNGDYSSYLCFETAGCINNFGGRDTIKLAGYGSDFASRDGLQTIASIEAVTGVPEPGTWAMMLLGFGAIGMAVRRRRKALVLARA